MPAAMVSPWALVWEPLGLTSTSLERQLAQASPGSPQSPPPPVTGGRWQQGACQLRDLSFPQGDFH